MMATIYFVNKRDARLAHLCAEAIIRSRHRGVNHSGLRRVLQAFVQFARRCFRVSETGKKGWFCHPPMDKRRNQFR